MLAREILKQYVVQDEAHRLSKTMHKDGAGSWQTIYEFPNGYRVSVVSGEIFYTDEHHPYEMMITNSNDPNNDAIGHLDEFSLLSLLLGVMEKENINGLSK